MIKHKIGLFILDGIGYAPNTPGNALNYANIPNMKKLVETYGGTTLQASGPAVGLPPWQPGNSEIGHLNIGAGRTIRSELVRINDDINNNQFVFNPHLQKAILLAKKKRVKLHIIGLASFGGVHSRLTHMLRVLTKCGIDGINTVVHCISDGRDCDVHSFGQDLPSILQIIDEHPNITIGTIGGRYYGMDRDKRWDRVKKATDAMLHKGEHFIIPDEYVASNYLNNITDEFIVPAYNNNPDAPNTILEENDVVLILNFRQDRVRQLCHLFKKSDVYDEPSDLWKLNLTLVTMTKYDGIDSDIIIYPPQDLPNTLGKVLSDHGLKQLRIAETEKYAHVTFFLDGGKDITYPNEERILVNSPKVATYDLKPEMSAYEVTDKLLANMNKYDVVICNYANCDMVGHTGLWKPTIKAIETVDECLGKVISKAKEIGMTLFITADHGNCDRMKDKEGKPVTSHSINPVWIVCTDKNVKFKNRGALNNIAPTILKYLDIPIPKEMDAKPLI